MVNPERKKVLILTYYWPPSGGAGVQRWLKFTKYLNEFNYEPLIYTAENPEYPSIDESLFKDIPKNLTVLKTKVWEPYKIYKLFTSQKKGHRINTGFLNSEKKKGLAERISVWIRGNWFIPDARKFWIRPSIKYLTSYLKDHPVDVIVSTGPPHSMHLIGMGLAHQTGIPWVADFRDPWTTIDFYLDLMLSARADRKHQRLETKVVQTASAVTVINKEMKRQFEKMGVNNVNYIPNGFDPDDIPDKNVILDSKFSISHIGSIVPSRNPDNLWQVLSNLVSKDSVFASDLEIKLIGPSDWSVNRSIEKAGLDEYLNLIDYLPHQDAVEELTRSQVLLLLINQTPNAKGILTGKFFEYMSSGRPILAIGPVDGEVAEILNETRAGQIVGFNDQDTLEKQILEYYNKFRNKTLVTDSGNIDLYSRRSLTGKMVELFNELLQ
jgi:hypothetical protein